MQLRHAPGAPPKLTADSTPLLQQCVKGGPVQEGLDRANRANAALADHLPRSRGIRVGKSAMHRFCSCHDIRPCRSTDRLLRGDPMKQPAAREELAALKKRWPANWCC